MHADHLAVGAIIVRELVIFFDNIQLKVVQRGTNEHELHILDNINWVGWLQKSKQ